MSSSVAGGSAQTKDSNWSIFGAYCSICEVAKVNPSVSVVIPTHQRPEMVCRAVRSALSQTVREIEVIVVVDGPDTRSQEVLAGISDPRLQVIVLSEPQGGAEARNVGVRSARAEWVAFLDDDDEWLPEKLCEQLRAARSGESQFPVVACRVFGKSPSAEYVWPHKLPEPDIHLSEYLLSRSTLFQGEGLVQTSMLFVKRELLLQIPFRKDLKRHHEWDWLLRAREVHGFDLVFLPRPLAVWYIEESRPSISRSTGWRYSLSWIQENRNRVTKRAYAGFVLTLVASLAAKEREWKAFPILLASAVRDGRPHPVHLVLYLGMWVVPVALRRKLRALRDGVNRR